AEVPVCAALSEKHLLRRSQSGSRKHSLPTWIADGFSFVAIRGLPGQWFARRFLPDCSQLDVKSSILGFVLRPACNWPSLGLRLSAASRLLPFIIHQIGTHSNLSGATGST